MPDLDFDEVLAGAGLIEGPAAAAPARRLEGTPLSRYRDRIARDVLDADAFATEAARHFGLRRLATPEVQALSLSPSAALSAQFLRDNCMLVADTPSGVKVVVTFFPGDREAVDALLKSLDTPVEIVVAALPDIEACHQRLTARKAQLPSAAAPGAGGQSLAALRDQASGAPAVLAVDGMIRDALELRATDIHIEPMRGMLSLRYRIDGVLRAMEPPAAALADAVVSRIKILAKLDTTERRKPQDGSFRHAASAGQEVEVRVATLPSIHGESLVMRLLQREAASVDLARIGLSPGDEAVLRRLLDHPHGMIAVAGPTGSGKTTTLAAALGALNDPSRKIVTIEDPVEYQIPGIIQSQVQPAIGLTFSAAIRSFVRQDPDIILVGEIRDGETARAAVQAALTGHLVLTTVHANTAASAFTRLRDLGIENYLLVGAMRGVISQRLVRRLCNDCKASHVITCEEVEADTRLAAMGFKAGDACQKAAGCGRCGHTGYKGRLAVFELLIMDEALSALAAGGADNMQLETRARAAGMKSMAADALRKALEGQTSVAEVVRVVGYR
jgi:general secretion pathway protein E